MPIVVSTRYRAPEPSPHVRRRWKLFATLLLLTVVGSDAALGLIFGGIEINGRAAEKLPLGSPVVAGWVVACTIAVPMGVAAYLTLGSHRYADTVVRIAGSLCALTAALTVVLAAA